MNNESILTDIDEGEMKVPSPVKREQKPLDGDEKELLST
jgi:hypothetical protein